MHSRLSAHAYSFLYAKIIANQALTDDFLIQYWMVLIFHQTQMKSTFQDCIEPSAQKPTYASIMDQAKCILEVD